MIFFHQITDFFPNFIGTKNFPKKSEKALHCSHIDVVVCSNKSNINLKQQVSETELKNSRCLRFLNVMITKFSF